MTRRGLIVAAALMAVASCDAGPQTGELTWSLSTPHGNTGAVAFAVTALEPNTVADVAAACDGCQAFTTRVSEREVRGVVVGAIAGGPLFHATVSNVRKPTLYSARVLEAASTEFQLLRTSDFQLTQQER